MKVPNDASLIPACPPPLPKAIKVGEGSTNQQLFDHVAQTGLYCPAHAGLRFAVGLNLSSNSRITDRHVLPCSTFFPDILFDSWLLSPFLYLQVALGAAPHFTKKQTPYLS